MCNNFFKSVPIWTFNKNFKPSDSSGLLQKEFLNHECSRLNLKYLKIQNIPGWYQIRIITQFSKYRHNKFLKNNLNLSGIAVVQLPPSLCWLLIQSPIWLWLWWGSVSPWFPLICEKNIWQCTVYITLLEEAQGVLPYQPLSFVIHFS